MLKKMGPLQGVLKLIPGLGNQLKVVDIDERQLARVEAIVLSMTPRGAGRAAPDRRLPPPADRGRQRADGPGREQAPLRPQADGEDDEADGEGKDAYTSRAANMRDRTEIGRMAVRMRLTRVGSKKNPIYRVVVADQRSPRDGRFIEIVGRYNPQTDPSTIELDEAKVNDWLGKGARPSEAVFKLMKAAGSDVLWRSCSTWLATPLVDDPDAVRVEQVEREDATVLELYVAEDDSGKVIGRQGRLAGRSARWCARAPPDRASASSSTSSSELVTVGRVGRPHGVDGCFFVEGGSDAPERFARGAVLLVNGDAGRVTVSKRGAGGRP